MPTADGNLHRTPDGGSSTGTLALDTGIKRSGASSLKVDSGAGNTEAYAIIGDGTTVGDGGVTLYKRIWVYIPAFPTNECGFIRLTGPNLAVSLASDGKLRFYQLGVPSTLLGTSGVMATGTWIKVEIGYYRVVAASSDYAEFLVNDTSVYSSTGLALTSGAQTTDARFGWFTSAGAVIGSDTPPGANKVLYFDDFAINDNSGGVNASWPGDGKVVLMKPASDNARSANWLAGAGGTSNLFDAVNNVPPVGVDLASATNTSQVKCKTALDTDDLDLNMDTYLAAGVPSDHRIVALMAFGSVGDNREVGGVHNIAIKHVSNPAASESSLPGLSAVAGTWPTNWIGKRAACVDEPTVTLGTAPVLRLGDRETANSTMMFAFAGVYAESVVAPAAPPAGGVSPPSGGQCWPRLVSRVRQGIGGQLFPRGN